MTFEIERGASLFLEYDWGQWVTSKSGDVGALSVRLAGSEIVGTLAKKNAISILI